MTPCLSTYFAYVVVLHILGLWLLSDFNKCSSMDDMHVFVEREKVVLLYMLLFVFVCTIFGSLHIANRFLPRDAMHLRY